MKTRGLTNKSRTPLLGNTSLVTPSSTSSVEPLTTTSSDESLTTSTLKSDVWTHFERCVNIFPLKAKCLLCQEELSTPNYGTSSLKRHLLQKHDMQKYGLVKVSHSSTIPIHLSKSEKQKLDGLAINAIIKDSRTFGDLKKPGIQKFIDALKPVTFRFTSNGGIESSGFQIAIALHFPAVVTCPQNLGFFLCQNKNCISKRLECDTHDHCGDTTDEISCSMIGKK